MPGIFRELENVRHQLENHYRDMQDIELLAFKPILRMTSLPLSAECCCDFAILQSNQS